MNKTYSLLPQSAEEAYAASPNRQTINASTFAEEAEALQRSLDTLAWTDALAHQAHQDAYRRVEQSRQASLKSQGGMHALMQHYDLSCQEGILLMCLAEALLRTPDKATKLLLIQDKLGDANWSEHQGKSSSQFVNMATLGLMFTGSALSKKKSHLLKSMWQNLVKRLGAPLIRDAVQHTMGALSTQFVLGESIEDALKKTRKNASSAYVFSYDMLGEAACTLEDAERYYQAYEHALKAVGEDAKQHDATNHQGRGGISIKLSSLYPHYRFEDQEKAHAYLSEKVKNLCLLAQSFNIHVLMDAEESNRLDLSLRIFETVFLDPELKNWEGLGLAVQSYQKRALDVLAWTVDLSKQAEKRVIVRLVKGAYWDSEIKEAQITGAPNYPVWTRKPHTDVNYLACARVMLAHPEHIYPAFATHNAHTVAAVLALMDNPKKTDFEWQHLQGMGNALHAHLLKEGYRNRVYAPVGTHEDLLPYLVRRLLENGANSSFVNQIQDKNVPIEHLIADPVHFCIENGLGRHPQLPLPKDLYQPQRAHANGWILSDWRALHALEQDLKAAAKRTHEAKPHSVNKATWEPVLSPSDGSLVGQTHNTTPEEALAAFERACRAHKVWDAQTADARASCLESAAALLEKNRGHLVYLIQNEAGRTVHDAIDDVREAIDFCFYYAAQAREAFAPRELKGPTGECNTLGRRGRGVMIAISPWNFPAAIFTGQMAAALAAGNTVLAKPAEQTPLTAAFITRLFHQAGVPKDALHCLTGDGMLGAYCVSELPHQGVLFTGSNEAAWSINQSLAKKHNAIVPLIAETGGMNVMIADSTALPEQLINDVMFSAFGSAGQRCSALRVLLVQDDIADHVLHLLEGAMACLTVGLPHNLATDVGPVIDEAALGALHKYISQLEKTACLIAKAPLDEALSQQGHFIAPHAFEIDDLTQLKGEVFGPILHVMRYRRQDLDQHMQSIRDWGFGLTFGIHSRIETSIARALAQSTAGNCYVNRSMTGAVVGVQPFGGSGLSGTGPKAGGPDYLLRLTQEVCVSVNTTAAGGNASLMMIDT